MGIVLMILKILALILLSLFGLILFLLLLILFGPFSYKTSAEFKDQMKDSKGLVSITYLFGLLSAKAGYNSGKKDWTGIQVSICGFGIYPKKDKKKTKKHHKRPKIKGSSRIQINLSDPDYVEEEELLFNSMEERKEDASFFDEKKEAGLPTPSRQKKKRKKRPSFLKKIKDKWKGFTDRATSLKEKVLKLIKVTSEWKKFLDSKNTHACIRIFKKALKKLLHILRIRQLSADLTIGTGDPATTGWILGGIASLFSFLPKKFYDTISIGADFENKVLHGSLKIKGRFCLGPILLLAWKVYRNKSVKRMLDELPN